MKKVIPTEIESERVLVRRLMMGDAEDIYRIFRRRETVKWMLTALHPYPKDKAVKFIRKSQQQWRAKKCFHFGVCLNETGQYIGGVGLKNVGFTHRCAEIGYGLDPDYWRQGLMTEAVQATLWFAFEHLNLYRIYAHAIEGNIGSWRVMEKCGMVREGTWRQAIVMHKERHSLLQYSILEPEWRKQKKKG